MREAERVREGERNRVDTVREGSIRRARACEEKSIIIQVIVPIIGDNVA